MKRCTMCEKEKSFDDFYSQNKTNAKDEKYTYYPPECKECTKKKTKEWRASNPDKHKIIYMKQNQHPNSKERMRVASKKQVESGYNKNYYHNNKEKFKQYVETRGAKIHDITDYEWEECLYYFNYSCAYCEMNETIHQKKFRQQLHRDHVDEEGSNYIDNCVPACKECNSQKSQFDINDWYSPKNIHYKKSRMSKIVKWVTVDSLILLNVN